MPTTSSFCCGVSLRTGALVTGWIQTVSAIRKIADDMTARESGTQISSDGPSMTASCLQLVLGVGLLFGIYKRHREFLLLYVLLQAANTVTKAIIMLITILSAIIMLFAGHPTAFSIVAIMFSFSLIWFLMEIYLIVVVYSFYKEMESHV